MVLLLILSLSHSSLQADELENKDILLILAIQKDIKNISTPMDNFITNSITLEFVINDFDIFIAEPEDNISLSSLKRRNQFSYLINADYSVDSNQVELHMVCYRIKDSYTLYQEKITSLLGLELDRDIEKHLDTMINRIEQDMRDNPDLLVRLPKQEQLPETPPSSDYRRPDISAVCGLFLPMGESRSYLHNGILSSIRFHYTRESPSFDFNLGWAVSVNVMEAHGQINTAQNIFTSTGPDIHLKGYLNQRFYLYSGINGGLCFWSINIDNQGYQGTVIPYTAADLGFGVVLSEKMMLNVSTEYSLYFEESLTIMGISPTVGVYINL